jgi:hypothetical protein
VLTVAEALAWYLIHPYDERNLYLFLCATDATVVLIKENLITNSIAKNNSVKQSRGALWLWLGGGHAVVARRACPTPVARRRSSSAGGPTPPASPSRRRGTTAQSQARRGSRPEAHLPRALRQTRRRACCATCSPSRPERDIANGPAPTPPARRLCAPRRPCTRRCTFRASGSGSSSLRASGQAPTRSSRRASGWKTRCARRPTGSRPVPATRCSARRSGTSASPTRGGAR